MSVFFCEDCESYRDSKEHGYEQHPKGYDLCEECYLNRDETYQGMSNHEIIHYAIYGKDD